MSLHSTCLPVAHEDEDLCLFTYSINSCIRPLALSCKRLCFIFGMNVINDLCICVLHLKLWMLAMIQGLALQSQGSFFLYKGGILHQRACRRSCGPALRRPPPWTPLLVVVLAPVSFSPISAPKLVVRREHH